MKTSEFEDLVSPTYEGETSERWEYFYSLAYQIKKNGDFVIGRGHTQPTSPTSKFWRVTRVPRTNLWSDDTYGVEHEFFLVQNLPQISEQTPRIFQVIYIHT